MPPEKLPDISRVRNTAEAYRRASEAAKLGTSASNAASRIAVLAEHKAGELIRKMQDEGLLAERGRPGKNSHAASLSDEGIDKDQSARWQKIADIPEEVIEEYHDECEERGEPASREGLKRFAKRDEPIDVESCAKLTVLDFRASEYNEVRTKQPNRG